MWPVILNAGSLGQPATSAPQPAVMNQATAAAAANAAAQAAVDAVLRSPVSASPAAQTSVETMEQVTFEPFSKSLYLTRMSFATCIGSKTVRTLHGFALWICTKDNMPNSVGVRSCKIKAE